MFTPNEHFHHRRGSGGAVKIVRSAPVPSLVLVSDPFEQQRTVGQLLHTRVLVRVERTPVSGPRDELEGRRRLNETADDTRQSER